jgi:hypothetical protein
VTYFKTRSGKVSSQVAGCTFWLVWRLEWLRAFRRPRLFRLNIIIPLLLIVPIALGAAPPAHAAAVYVVLFILFGTFGAAIPALRDAEHGLIRRLALSALDARQLLLARAAANGCVDGVQLLPALGIIVVTGGGSPVTALWLAAALLGSLTFANLIGLWLAALARSVAEGALFAAVTALLLLHASGVFRTPLPGSIGAWVELYAPYRALHELLLGGQSIQAHGLVTCLAVLLVATYAGAPRLLTALARADARA